MQTYEEGLLLAQSGHLLICERRQMPLVENVMVYRRNLDHNIAAVDGLIG